MLVIWVSCTTEVYFKHLVTKRKKFLEVRGNLFIVFLKASLLLFLGRKKIWDDELATR